MFWAANSPIQGLSGATVVEVCLFDGVITVCGFAGAEGAGSEGSVLCPFTLFWTGDTVMIV